MKVNVDHYVFDIKRMFPEAHEKLEGMFTDEVSLHVFYARPCCVDYC
jgi:hypothetical protein